MTTKLEGIELMAVAATVAQVQRAVRHKAQELWAGIVYLLVWLVLWLAVVVGVLAPLEAFFAGGPR